MMSFLNKFRKSIKYKLIAASVIPIVIAIFYLSYISSVKQKETSTDFAASKVSSLSEMLSFSVGAGLEESNFELVQKAFEWAKADPNVVFINILDENNESIIMHNPKNFPSINSLDENLYVIKKNKIQYANKYQGNLELAYSLEKIQETINEEFRNSILTGLILVVLAIIGIMLPLRKMLKQIFSFIDYTEKLSEGDLSESLKKGSEDEIGHLTDSINSFVDSLNQLLGKLVQEGVDVNASAEELTSVSEMSVRVLNIVREKTEKVVELVNNFSKEVIDIASTTEEMSTNTEKVTQNVNSLNEMTREISEDIATMSRSIDEVLSIADNSSVIAGNAVQYSEQATETMSALGNAAKEIGNVTELIKRIAEQTNLLALNATIEAASAGEAGKGFAVVANEIKELANQSSKAAEDIAEKISGIQKNTGDAVEVNSNVVKIIQDIDDSIKQISNAISQQAQITNNIVSHAEETKMAAESIAANFNEMAVGANDLARTTSNAANEAEMVSQELADVEQSTLELESEITKVTSSSDKLKGIAENINIHVQQFKLKK